MTPEKAQEIHADQINCMGCLSACLFSNWAQNDAGTTGKKADPRSYCIQKTLQTISHSAETESNLMFAGHNAYRFKDDPFYANGFVPTVQQLVERLDHGGLRRRPNGARGGRAQAFFARCPNSSTRAL